MSLIQHNLFIYLRIDLTVIHQQYQHEGLTTDSNVVVTVVTVSVSPLIVAAWIVYSRHFLARESGAYKSENELSENKLYQLACLISTPAKNTALLIQYIQYKVKTVNSVRPGSCAPGEHGIFSLERSKSN
jgi:hypothetical protein